MELLLLPALLALLAASVLSVFGEQGHLHWRAPPTHSYGSALLFVLGFVVCEYLLSVWALRTLHTRGWSVPLLYAIFNLGQIVTCGILVYVVFGKPLNVYHILGYLTIAGAVALMAYGDHVQSTA